jgi:hypothetical protein
VSAWRKLPLTAQAAAAYTPRLEEGLPSNTSVRQTQWRGAPSPDNSMRPGSAGAMGSQATDGGDVHVVGAAGQTQAVTHGGPEAVGKHSQVQLWWRDATSHPGRQLSPADFLASCEHVDELCTEQRRHDELRI